MAVKQNLVVLIHEAVNAKGSIHDEPFDKALAKIHDLLGVPSGDVAGHYFDELGQNWTVMNSNERLRTMLSYIDHELFLLTRPQTA